MAAVILSAFSWVIAVSLDFAVAGSLFPDGRMRAGVGLPAVNAQIQCLGLIQVASCPP